MCLCRVISRQSATLEEFLHAVKAQRPVYLIGGLGGAARVIARALCSKRTAVRPPELTLNYYRAQKSTRKLADYGTLLGELKAAGDMNPEDRFKELWTLIKEHRGKGFEQIFRNGLSDEDNKTLITTVNTYEAVRLVWAGFSQLPGMLGPLPTSRISWQKHEAGAIV